MENNEIIGWIPWPVAAATAIWFGVMAFKSGKNRVLWSIGGGVLGFVVTTIVLGLAQATFIPFDSEEIHPFRLKVVVLAVVIVFCLGWLFTGGMHQQLRALLKRREEAPAPTQAKSPAPASTKQ